MFSCSQACSFWAKHLQTSEKSIIFPPLPLLPPNLNIIPFPQCGSCSAVCQACLLLQTQTKPAMYLKINAHYALAPMHIPFSGSSGGQEALEIL